MSRISDTLAVALWVVFQGLPLAAVLLLGGAGWVGFWLWRVTAGERTAWAVLGLATFTVWSAFGV